MTDSGQLDIATVQSSEFSPHVDSEFTLSAAPAGGGATDPGVLVTLVEVSEYPDHRADDGRHNRHRQPFSLVFRCDTSNRLEQGSYRFEHAEMPSFDLFVTPVDGGADWCKIEAVLN